MTLSDLKRLGKIFRDMKHREASLRQQSYLYFLPPCHRLRFLYVRVHVFHILCALYFVILLIHEHADHLAPLS